MKVTTNGKAYNQHMEIAICCRRSSPCPWRSTCLCL